MQNNDSILALINLIDDPDESIYTHIRDQLLQYGPDAIPYLESSWEHEDYGLVFQDRVENLIHEIQFETTKEGLKKWLNSDDKDLLEGSIIIAKTHYPGLKKEKIEKEIAKIQRDVWLEINDNQTAMERIRIFNRVFFNFYNFQGDAKNFHSPMNSYINIVLENKKGNPLSLSLIYSVVAQRLGMPVYGVNLPNQFVLAYMDEFAIKQFLPDNNGLGVLFYINTFAKGSVFDDNEIKEFLDSLKLPHSREYFEPCSNSIIIKRMLTNLIASFQQVGNIEKVEELILLRDMIS